MVFANGRWRASCFMPRAHLSWASWLSTVVAPDLAQVSPPKGPWWLPAFFDQISRDFRGYSLQELHIREQRSHFDAFEVSYRDEIAVFRGNRVGVTRNRESSAYDAGAPVMVISFEFDSGHDPIRASSVRAQLNE